VGPEWERFAEIFGSTKTGYAKKWGYRSYVHRWSDWANFSGWCSRTRLGARVGAERSAEGSHPVIKFCAVAHALDEQGCRLVLWTDADAVIFNWDISIDLDWPGAVSSDEQPQMLLGLSSFPQGASKAGWGSSVVPEEDGYDFCTSSNACSSFSKVWSCYNSGAFLVRRSASALVLLRNIVENSLNPTDECSTADKNPWHVDQCWGGQTKDQCLTGCALDRLRSDRGADADAVPGIVSCVSLASRPRLQEVISASWLRHDGTLEPSRQPLYDTFVVNPIGGSKGKLVKSLADRNPHIRDLMSNLDAATKEWLLGR